MCLTEEAYTTQICPKIDCVADCMEDAPRHSEMDPRDAAQEDLSSVRGRRTGFPSSMRGSAYRRWSDRAGVCSSSQPGPELTRTIFSPGPWPGVARRQPPLQPGPGTTGSSSGGQDIACVKIERRQNMIYWHEYKMLAASKMRRSQGYLSDRESGLN